MTFGRWPNQIALALLAWALASSVATACPFCTSTSQSLAEEIGSMDVVVIAQLTHLPPISDKPGEELAKATFEVSSVLKGAEHLAKGAKIETIFFGDSKLGSTFLIMAIEPKAPQWSTPLPISKRAEAYLSELTKLPKDSKSRLLFFQNYLEDADELLARDTYDEFAKASYAQVIELKDQMKHDQLVTWIKNPEVPASRRRLYLTMLGICGGEQDLPLLESLINSTDRKAKAGLDAIVGCYLTLKGEAGLPLIENLFLKNKKSDYAETYSTIMALRFHISEGGVIKRERLMGSLRLMLDRPELADLIIPDLAQGEDWSAMEQLFSLYKNADEKSSWVRIPVINYLRKCPLPKAKELLVECEKIDPVAMKRANTYFPTDAPPAVDPAKASLIAPRDFQNESGGQVKLAGFEQPASGISPTPNAEIAAAAPVGDSPLSSVNKGAAPAAAASKKIAPPPNLWLVLGVPWGIGLVLAAVQWSILRGSWGSVGRS
jgi:hypothetical protein